MVTYSLTPCDGADESLDEAVGHYPGRQGEKAVAGMQRQLEMVAEGHVVPSVRREERLPDGSYFFRARHRDLRAYFWYSKSHKATIFVSHFCYKNYDALDPGDTRRVIENWNLCE